MLVCVRMSEIAAIERFLWAITFVLNLGLVFLLLYRRNYRAYPFFFVYSVSTVLQNIAFFESYRIWGFNSPASIRVAWGTQMVVTAGRALAVAEICHRVLAQYAGVWKLARHLLIGAAAAVALFSWGFSQGNWRSALLSLDRGMELAIASAIAILFLFARYYDVRLEQTTRTMGIGFFLYSGFRVLDNTIVEHWLTHSTALWNLLGTLTFLASLLLWTWALRLTQQRTTSEVELLPENRYHLLSPEINTRLRALNEQLGDFWHAEGKKT